MAKACMVARDKVRMKSSQLARNKRLALKKIISDAQTEYEEKMVAVEKLNKMPRNTSGVRVQRRCRCCGRPRAVYRKFELCRICLRQFMMKGDVTGLVKASW